MANEHAAQRRFKGSGPRCLRKQVQGGKDEVLYSYRGSFRRRFDNPGDFRPISCNRIRCLASGRRTVRRHAQRAQISVEHVAEAGGLSQWYRVADDRPLHRRCEPARHCRSVAGAAAADDPLSLVRGLARSCAEWPLRHWLGLRQVYQALLNDAGYVEGMLHIARTTTKTQPLIYRFILPEVASFKH